MYHTLEFHSDLNVDLEVSPTRLLEQLRIRRGTRLGAQVKPHVVETPAGLVEVADLFLSDGTVARSVPFEFFSFVEESDPES